MAFVFVILALVVFALTMVFNRLVTSRNRVRESWSDIDVQLKRRYDLIPNLVETVKVYVSHEANVLENVVKARSAAMGAQTITEHSEAENNLSQALKSVFALVEAYPQLRAVDAFVGLQKELTDTENKIEAARRFYNANVLVLNNKVESFPANIIAQYFKFNKEQFFQLGSEAEREPVKVNF
jgi:LemA protein